MSKQFGKKTLGLEYKDRPGAYALILREDGMLGVVESHLNHDKFMLPGGGIDEGETDEQGLRRELMEEMVREVAKAEFVGEACEYIDHPEKGPLNKICKFFLTELVPAPDGNGDRVTRWITIEEFKKNAVQEAHVWAVEKFKENKG